MMWYIRLVVKIVRPHMSARLKGNLKLDSKNIRQIFKKPQISPSVISNHRIEKNYEFNWDKVRILYDGYYIRILYG